MKALVSNSKTEARCQKVECQVVQLLSLDSTTNFHTEMYTKINSDKISIAIALYLFCCVTVDLGSKQLNLYQLSFSNTTTTIIILQDPRQNQTETYINFTN